MHHEFQAVERRDFIKAGAAITAISMLPQAARVFAAQAKKNGIVMAKLPYADNALEPYISARTVKLHYNKHHRSYFDLVKGWAEDEAEYQGQSLEKLIAKTKGGILRDESVYFMSVLLYNHNLYWPSMKPQGGGAPKKTTAIGKAIGKTFGSYDAFRKKMLEESMKLGSGWVFLVGNREGLSIQRMDYHKSPLQAYFTPLIAIDVWEHAYYLDYQDDREKYVNTWLDKLVNWECAEANLKKIK